MTSSAGISRRLALALGSLLALVTLLLAACEDSTGPEAVLTEPFEFVRDATGITGFDLTAINGEVEVVGVSQGNTLRITGFRRVDNCSRSRAEDLFDELRVMVGTAGQEIVIETDQPDNAAPCNLVVHYEIAAPRELAARMLSVNGAVTVDGMQGGLWLTSVNGAVTLDDIEHDVSVHLTNGPIVADISIDGDEHIDLLTVNGAIQLFVPTTTSAMLTASVVNGAMTVDGLTLADAMTTPTSISGRLGSGEGEIDLRTTNGAISLIGH